MSVVLRYESQGPLLPDSLEGGGTNESGDAEEEARQEGQDEGDKKESFHKTEASACGHWPNNTKTFEPGLA
jgi:hypothetical protein